MNHVLLFQVDSRSTVLGPLFHFANRRSMLCHWRRTLGTRNPNKRLDHEAMNEYQVWLQRLHHRSVEQEHKRICQECSGRCDQSMGLDRKLLFDRCRSTRDSMVFRLAIHRMCCLRMCMDRRWVLAVSLERLLFLQSRHMCHRW